MIQKIKDLMAIKEQIDVLKNNMNYATSSVGEMKNDITSLKQHINDSMSSISDKNNEFFKNFDENINSIKDIKSDFEKELFDFKLLKGQMQRKIIEKFEEEMGKELKIQMDKLKGDSEKYNELKEKVEKITNTVNNASEEINKFVEISQNIKTADFELTKFARQLLDSDREKLELMRKIDTLERLVSKMRKPQYVMR